MAVTRKRVERQEEIRRVVRAEEIHTQAELAGKLQEAGYECTQATVSRDMSELGLSKESGSGYVLAEDLHLHRMVSELVLSVVHTNNLVLVKASPGSAQGVAAALDGAELEGILGSIAGDDTVLVIMSDESSARELEKHVSAYMDEG
jgi:transcriptional regulator of arginine metabolism